MSKANNLQDFLIGVADAIRAKKGTEALIDPQDFDTEIANLPSGGGGMSSLIDQSVTSVSAADFGNATEIRDYMFYGCASLESVVIPSTITKIGSYAFGGCSSLTSITIPSSVTSIGTNAFSGCSGLTSVVFDDNSNLSTIASRAFYNCTSLTDIVIPNSVTSIGGGAFQFCSALVSMSIPFVGDSVKTSTDTYQYPFGYIFGVSSSTYPGITNVKQYYHGPSASNITNSTYGIPSNLRSVTVTGGNILYGAFMDCSMLTSITMPNNITSIESVAFSMCSGITSITLPNGIIYVGSGAFGGCSGLTSVYYMGTISSWCGITFDGSDESGTNPLYYAHNLYINNELIKEIEIPGTVTEIKQGVFCGWNGTSVVIPSGVTSVASYAFCGCNYLNDVVLPNSLTSIGTKTFKSCVVFTQVVIPENVTAIYAYAFSSCINVQSVTLYATTPPPTFSSDAFSGSGGISSCPIYVPAESVSTYKSASEWASLSSRIQAIPSN